MNAVWKGVDALGETPQFQQMGITAAEYAASGPGIVHQKCF